MLEDGKKENNIRCIIDIENKYNDILNENLSQLNFNDPVVHIDHGIGRYQGLITIETDGVQSEYLVILYAEENKLYLPISYLHLVSPYTGTQKNNAPLHRLGGESWKKEKKKISKHLCDYAAKLLDIYSKRKSQKGFSFQKKEKKYNLFCKDFPFNTTPDQKKVITSVLEDMYKRTPMDRLVCGDVGFGKTEVAMRASFLSVLNHKQVAILVPTTLLAQQHFSNFKKRFSRWPYIIDILSRFRTQKEQSLILRNVEKGKINILIGTHKLLLKNINWYDLGLLIIDEEHRFGVNHKEIIKKLHSNVDTLTLTATPIPRTLNMAMIGIKKLSIIAHPPSERLTIKTFVQQYSSILVRKSILFEISRGGQVYYVYNKVRKINQIARKLKILIPEATIEIAHGQMNKVQLKKIMNDFYYNQFNVLVCTTIIESGIDIPRVNTIIVENADHFGLSQLHQLRGRVGRSNYQAYAWFFVNDIKYATSEAKQRLEAISSNNHLSSGLHLSNRDLEIRGVGELLGKEQSGHINNIGYSLYMKLLKRSIHSLKKRKYLSLDELFKEKPKIELCVPSFLPDSYVLDINTRLCFYKKIAVVENEKELKKIKYQLENAFGKLPKIAENLILIAHLRLMSQEIGIKSIKLNKNGGILKFRANNLINIKYLLNIFQKNPNHWKMEGPTKLRFIQVLKDDYLRINWITQLLKNIKKNLILNK
ncbi:transcription-repair coupling factor [Buchnera aphidicola (Muscaphis stroyani)]|uniref:Transcription-repair-coupling factor n=1 Tax=Buchnera aphidicola (Muscaphis stroyani) TaxID=1241869 RepID=A0A4D6YIU1_9GAMM|nr:transcription-repair coupling factor [Buchnera aphidicola]QCI24365.1 transcription-repair coupling factor [Buchnera aphidicola (Muscaphis stroyani)]